MRTRSLSEIVSIIDRYICIEIRNKKFDNAIEEYKNKTIYE